MRPIAVWVLMAAALAFADPPHFVEIKIPADVDPAKVFVRYTLDGDFGGWIDPSAHVSSYFIATTRHGKAASRLKILAYAPGCAIKTFDLEVSRLWPQAVSLDCERIPTRSVSGTLSGLKDAHIEAKFTARWIRQFFGTDSVITPIPVARGMYFANAGRFRMSIPDFSAGPRPGEIEFWATDPATGKILTRLVPTQPVETASEIRFALCDTSAERRHDSFGFTLRDVEPDSACAASPLIKK